MSSLFLLLITLSIFSSAFKYIGIWSSVEAQATYPSPTSAKESDVSPFSGRQLPATLLMGLRSWMALPYRFWNFDWLVFMQIVGR